MPKEDTENGDLDEYEREIEEFKRCAYTLCFIRMIFELRRKTFITHVALTMPHIVSRIV
jgi:hypothetical protein